MGKTFDGYHGDLVADMCTLSWEEVGAGAGRPTSENDQVK